MPRPPIYFKTPASHTHSSATPSWRMSSTSGPPNAAPPSRLQELLGSIPIVTLTLTAVCITVFVVECVLDFGAMVSASSLSPASVFGDVQLYRIVSAAFTHLSVLHIGMNMMSLVSLGSSLEPLFGSLGFFFLTLLYVMLVGVLFLGLASSVAVTVARSFWWTSVAGFSGVLFSFAVDESSLSPLPTRSVFGLFSVPTRLYPWVLMVVLQVLLPNVSFLGHLSGLLVGVLHSMGALAPLLPSLASLKAIEQMRCLSPITRLPSYRLAPSADPVVVGPVGVGVASACAWMAHVLRPITDRLPRFGRGGGGESGGGGGTPRRILGGRLLSPSGVSMGGGSGGSSGGGESGAAIPTRTSAAGEAGAAQPGGDCETGGEGDTSALLSHSSSSLGVSTETISMPTQPTSSTTVGTNSSSSSSSSNDPARDRLLRAQAAEARLAASLKRGIQEKQAPV